MPLGRVDLRELDALGLLTLGRLIGVVPMTPEKKSLTEEVLRKTLEEFMHSA